MKEVVENSPIVPEEVNSAFIQALIKLGSGNKRTPGRRPVRAERIRAVFSGRELDAILLEDFAEAFSDTVDPEKAASSAIGSLNKLLDKLGIGLTIERTSADRFRRK